MRYFSDLSRRIRSDSRLERIFRGSTTALLGRVLSIVINLISLPLTVRYLGKLEYGIWVTVSTSVTMLAVLDLGIASTLTNSISKAFAADDEAMARRYFATALWMTTGVVLALALIAAAVFPLIDWASVFHLAEGSPLATATRWSVGLCVGFFLLNLPLTLANRVLSGYQENHIANKFAMLNSVLGLIAIVLTVCVHGGLVALTLAYCAATLLGTLLMNAWLSFLHRPGIKPAPSAVDWRIGRELFGQGSLFFVLQLAGLAVFNTDNLIIAHFLGPQEVTPYSVAWRLCGYASMFQSLLNPTVWPAYSEAYFRGDLDWIRRQYSRIMRGSVLFVGAAAIVIGFTGRFVIRIWAGQAAVPGRLLLWCMCVWVVILSVTVNQAMLMAATERLRVQAVSSTIAAIANLVLSILWVQRIGALGVLLATLTTYTVFILAPQWWETARILRGQYMQEPAGL